MRFSKLGETSPTVEEERDGLEGDLRLLEVEEAVRIDSETSLWWSSSL